MKIIKLTIEVEPQQLSILAGTISRTLDNEVKDYDTFEGFREDHEKELEFLQMADLHGQYWGGLVPSGKKHKGEMTYEHKEFNSVNERFEYVFNKLK